MTHRLYRLARIIKTMKSYRNPRNVLAQYADTHSLSHQNNIRYEAMYMSCSKITVAYLVYCWWALNRWITVSPLRSLYANFAKHEQVILFSSIYDLFSSHKLNAIKMFKPKMYINFQRSEGNFLCSYYAVLRTVLRKGRLDALMKRCLLCEIGINLQCFTIIYSLSVTFLHKVRFVFRCATYILKANLCVCVSVCCTFPLNYLKLFLPFESVSQQSQSTKRFYNNVSNFIKCIKWICINWM